MKTKKTKDVAFYDEMGVAAEKGATEKTFERRENTWRMHACQNKRK